MKLGIFVVSALSLVFAFVWLMVYCPSDVINTNSNSHDRYKFRSKEVDDDEYFEQIEKELLEEVENEKIYESKKKSSLDRGKNQENKVPEELFTDEAFERLIGELNHKNIQGFEFMAESTNVTIYRKPKGNAGLYTYKLYAVLPHATTEQVTSVFLDNEYRLVWDGYVTSLYHVKKPEKGPDVLYFNVDYPWPLANRDYVYAREVRRLVRDGKEYLTLVMHSVLHDSVPLEKGVIRVNDYHQSVVMTNHGPSGLQAYIEYYDDPKGSVPSWLVNWAAKTGVPSFLNDLQRACSGLNAYLEKHNRPMLTVPLHD